jgi:TonB family protein
MANVESPSATEPFCVWTQASRNFAIQISPDVIGSLATESLVAFKRVPRRGLETGGILLGRTELLGDTTTFWIEGFAPIESEHRFGPSYLLSDSDFAHLQTELSTNGTASLGIYRSQTRSEQLAIQDADVGLFAKCFGVSDNLFLMLAPVTRLGAFYFREDGNFKCVHQFVLVSSLSSVATQGRKCSPHVNVDTPAPAGTHSTHANIAGHSADQIDALVVASQRSNPNAPPEALSAANRGTGISPSQNAGGPWSFAAYGPWMAAIRRWAVTLWGDSSARSSSMKLRSWVLAAVALAVLTVGLLSYSFHPAVRPAAAPDHRAPNYLYLTVERDGPALRLLWDGNSPSVRGATRAVLHIQDGDQQSDRELAPSQLLAGQITYQPQHSAVTFRLNVYAGEPNAIGLVQVMLPPSPIAAPPPAQPIPHPTQNSLPIERPPVRAIAHAEAPAALYALTARSYATRSQNIQAQLPVVTSPVAAKMSPPVAHEMSPPARVEESPWHSLNAAQSDIPPSGRELTVRASTTPVPGSRWGGLFGKIPLLRRLRKQGKAVDAVPVNQPRPIVRIPGDQQLSAPVDVGVKVDVNKSGKVNDAEVVDYGDDPLSPTLANAALAAARNWTFAPPQVDDVPVASQLIIHFYFSP